MSNGHRFSVAEYYRLDEIGVLRPDARVELLNGVVIDMRPGSPLHASLVMRLTSFLTLNANDRWLVSPRNPVHLDAYSEPIADVALVKPRSDSYTWHHPKPAEVFLLIEVSDTTLDYDREEKLPAYGRAGIAEAWIVNLNDVTIEIYREPHFTGYASKAVLQAGDQVAPQAFPDAVVNVAELLKR